MEILENGNIQLLRWEQDVTLKNVDDFRMAVWKLLDGDKNMLILDLSGVVYLNSAALGVTADAVLSSKRNHKELIVSGVQPTVKEIFKIVRFSTFMKMFDELQEALHYYHNVEG
jgi:anti-sigma B factor antagonist